MADTIDVNLKLIENESQTAGSEESCHLLRIPIEIRFEIYRYLLLSSPKIYASPKIKLEKPNTVLHTDTEDSSEDEWTDETDEDSDHDSSYYGEFEDGFDDESGSDSSEGGDEEGEEEEEEEEKRHLAVLRTNRQIHSEASTLFYTEAVLTLIPDDVFSLTREPHIMEQYLQIRRNVIAWKHNPLTYLGKKSEEGVAIYDAPELLGDLEPHIFANFQKIAFDGSFDESDTNTGDLELWIDDETHVIKEEDATLFKSRVRSMTIFEDLVQILSNSQRITHLAITLEVEATAVSNLIIKDEESDVDSDTDTDIDIDEKIDMAMKVDKIRAIADFKAAELFLDSHVMDPLLKLSNVSHFDFKLGFDGFDDLTGEEAYRPPPKYVKLVGDMKDEIEGNLKELMNEA